MSDIGSPHLVSTAAWLTVGRQAGAAAFTLAVLVLPRFASRDVVDGFVWAYFSALFLSSLLNLGLERAMASTVAQAPLDRAARTAGMLLLARGLSTPMTIASLWLLFEIVGVRVSVLAWWSAVVWIVAIQIEGVAFALLRVMRRAHVEPVLALVIRFAQSACLLLLAYRGASLGVLVAVVAGLEALAAGWGLAAAARGWELSRVSLAGLPWRLLCVYTAVELLAFSYLRIDTVFVGRLLGEGAGATYGLVYRVIDAMTALATPTLLLVFPHAARLVAEGKGVGQLRRTASRVVPRAALVLALVVLGLAGVLAAVVPRIAEGVDALRLLIATVPLLYFSAFEMHLRSAEDRNGNVLATGVIVLTVNVVLNLMLIPAHGMTGAAWALVLAEVAQLSVIVITSGPGVPMLADGLVAGLVLLGMVVVAALANAGQTAPAVLLGITLAAASVTTLRAEHAAPPVDAR